MTRYYRGQIDIQTLVQITQFIRPLLAVTKTIVFVDINILDLKKTYFLKDNDLQNRTSELCGVSAVATQKGEELVRSRMKNTDHREWLIQPQRFFVEGLHLMHSTECGHRDNSGCRHRK